MSKLATLILAFALLGVATAATAQTAVVEDPAVMEDPAAVPDAMTCQVFPSQHVPPSDDCYGEVDNPRLMYAPARFYVNNFKEGYTEVLWSRPSCDRYTPSCYVSISANTFLTVTATVKHHDTGRFTDVSARAFFSNGL